MQYSSNGINWTFSSNAPFDQDKIAKSLDIEPGDYIYYRDREGDLIQKLQWGKSNKKPKRPF
jgi:hypothetical protein